VRLNLQGTYKITDLTTGKKLLKGSTRPATTLSMCAQQLCLDTRPLGTNAIRIQASKGLGVQAGSLLTWYRGNLEIRIDKTGQLSTINRLELEEYLRGVLPREVPANWPINALQAQAVASRTYALYKIAQAGERDYDVYADVSSQVYGGRSAEHPRTDKALKQTRAKALVYRKKPVPAFFHANCGGHTENVIFVWNEKSDVLQGTACPYCLNRPGYAWARNFHSSTVQALLNSSGYILGPIDSIEVAQRSPSGRAVELRMHDSDNATLTMPATEFRMLLGPDVVRSTYFDVVMRGYYFDLIGRGWGHGVGMCQQGAFGMAAAKKTMPEILNFYYPGATLKKMY